MYDKGAGADRASPLTEEASYGFERKKFFKTVVDITSKDFETIYISAGKVGYQIEISVEDLAKVIRVQFDDLVK